MLKIVESGRASRWTVNGFTALFGRESDGIPPHEPMCVRPLAGVTDVMRGLTGKEQR